jgi:hypothetical protein
LQTLKKRGTKANPLMNFLSKGKLNVNMGRSYGNPRMRSFGSMICLMNLLFDESFYAEAGFALKLFCY